jgi:UPF0755 protein
LKKKILIVLITLFIFFALSIGFGADLWYYSHRASSPQKDGQTITIRPGQSFKSAAELLHTKGLLESPFRFGLLARLKGHDKKLQAGEYHIAGAMTPLEILDKLVKGEVKLHKITIPEGFNIHQVAELMAETGFAAKEAFLAAATDADFARELGIAGETFEGYLFPETYYFPKGIQVRAIVTTLVNRFWSVFDEEWRQQGKQNGFSIHQIVTLASIIEKETGDPAERAIISSVFHNRLKKRMRLESDPTVIYALKDFDGNLTRKHLATPTPYNTYKIKGLPIGPIANPGRESLDAALFPANTPYLYFVSKKDSTHQFSTNLKDHNKAVRKYQLRR